DANIYRRALFGALLIVALGASWWLLSLDAPLPLPAQVVGWLLVLFVCCMVCHGELARLRPDPSYLTSYYLTIAAGGAMGGMLGAIGAPLVFTSFLELHVGLIICAVLFLAVLASNPDSALHGGRPRWAWAGLGAATLAFATALISVGNQAGIGMVARSR